MTTSKKQTYRAAADVLWDADVARSGSKFTWDAPAPTITTFAEEEARRFELSMKELEDADEMLRGHEC